MEVSFSPFLSVSDAAKNYQDDRRHRIDNIFDISLAQALLGEISTQVEFQSSYVSHGEYKNITPKEVQAMSPQARQDLFKLILQQAAQGIGFLYDRMKVNDLIKQPLLRQLFNFLNSEETLAKIREITGHSDLVSANAQVTRYTGTQFLTRHNDINEQEQRRVAYVMSFTETWHPDWGGLLQFYEDNGTVRDAWSPKFNSLSLFDVNHVHAVTYVTPFALKPRLSVTGWFCAK